jgi:hypothetical protein
MRLSSFGKRKISALDIERCPGRHRSRRGASASHGSKGLAGAVPGRSAGGSRGLEIAAKELQRVPFLMDLRRSPDAEAAKDFYRRAPSLQRMLKEKCRDDCRKR